MTNATLIIEEGRLNRKTKDQLFEIAINVAIEKGMDLTLNEKKKDLISFIMNNK